MTLLTGNRRTFIDIGESKRKILVLHPRVSRATLRKKNLSPFESKIALELVT